MTGKELRHLRVCVLEIPIKELSRLLEVLPSTVSRWERGKVKISGPVAQLVTRLAKEKA
jgi:DNA-binding transcriptional regulator YiaG